MSQIIAKKQDFRRTPAYRAANTLYALTIDFCNRFVKTCERTARQMQVSARTVRQSIAEVAAARHGGKPVKIKHVAEAQAATQDLLAEYEDFLILNRLDEWETGTPDIEQTVSEAAQTDDPAYFQEKSRAWNAETYANMMISLVNQANLLLRRLLPPPAPTLA